MSLSNTIVHSDRRTILLRDLLFYLLIGTMLFDFRSDDSGGGAFVVVMGLSNLALGITLTIHMKYLRRGLVYAMLPLIFYIVEIMVVGFLRDQPPYHIAARSVPVMIYLFASLCAANFARTFEEQDKMLTTIIVFAILAALWKLFFSFAYYHVSLATIRYQVLSGATPLLFSYAVTAFLLGRRKYMVMALILSLGVVAVSITRTYLLVFALSGMIALLALPGRRLGRAVPGFLIGLMMLFLALVAVQITMPEVIERWVIRLSASQHMGFDLTGATRLAEAEYQIQRLRIDNLGLLFGFGPDAITHFAGINALRIESVLGPRGLDFTGHGYGHNFYVGLIYVAGLFGGGTLIVSFLALLIKGILQARATLNQAPPVAAFTLLWGISAFAGYLAYSSVGGTFGDRSMCLFFGLSTGLLLAGIHWTRQQA